MTAGGWFWAVVGGASLPADVREMVLAAALGDCVLAALLAVLASGMVSVACNSFGRNDGRGKIERGKRGKREQ